MVGRGLYHLRPFGQDHGLENVDHLSDAGHFHPIAVLVENVQGNACHKGVAHGVLLIEEAGIGAGLHLKPVAPLVHDHADLLFRIIFVHDCTVTHHQLFHIQGFYQGLVPVGFVKDGGASLILPSVGMHIVMQRQAVHESGRIRGAGFQHLFRPVIIVHVRAAADFVNGSVLVVLSHIGLIPSVKIRIILGSHVAAAAPVFISHAEIVQPPGLFVAVFLSLIRHGGYAVKGDVLHPFGHFLYGAASHVAVHISLTVKLSAQLEKFVGAEAVVFHHAAPVGVDHLFSVFLRPDAVHPVVFIREAAARPAQDGDLHFP